MKELSPRQVALWRYAILGPLVSARLEHGNRRAYFEEAASRLYEHPVDQRKVKVSARTIETWYYAYKASGLDGLEPKRRRDRNTTSALDGELVELVVRAKQARPRRSVPQIIRVLQRAGRVAPGSLSRSTVLRVLRRHGVTTCRARRHQDKHRLAFLPEYAGDLWLGDAMHGPRVLVDGKLRKSYLLSILDGATRYIVGSEFRLSESALEHEEVLQRALRVHGRPRTYYVDRGAAYVSHSLRAICAELGVYLLHTETRDAEAKGAIERWHRTWRAEVGVEVEGSTLELAQLNAVHAAWVSREYHARVHTTTGQAPRSHFLAQADAGHLRPLAREVDIERVFWHRVRRRVRLDNTLDLDGQRFEVAAMGLSGRRIELRYDPRDRQVPPKVYEDDKYLCDTRVVDLHGNARKRRRRRSTTAAKVIVDPVDGVGDLLRAHYGEEPGDSEEEA